MLSQQSDNPRQHPLVKRIDQWEEESIAKIRQVAEETRNTLVKITSQQTNGLRSKLKELTDELLQSRQRDDFVETDVNQWKEKMTKLENKLINPPFCDVVNDSIALINKIRIDDLCNDMFERTSGNTIFEENGRVVVKDNSNSQTEVRGKNEYTSGRHTLCFQIEKLSNNGWIFFGIISKSESIRPNSYNSASSYGWQNQNHAAVGGQWIQGQGSDVAENDKIKLLFDCDNRLIQLINERTNRTIELRVDINKCPFPWQLHLNLQQALTRVRILSNQNST
ncbi:unnamed protein product [Rotaria sp. Silwood1]|nr:unnamed protein product [Rotaria sp. Silwood1]